MPFFRNLMPPNQLNPGDVVFSATRNFQLIMQGDGNLVLYAIDDASLPRDITKGTYKKAIWSSGTNGKGAVRCTMQSDGNLVLYTKASKAIWDTRTNGHPGAFLRCQDDGNLVILGANAWSSKTSAGPRSGSTPFGKSIPIGEGSGGGALGGGVPPPDDG